MQALTTLGSPIAWLFAQALDGARNGFSVTGGKANYTMNVNFPESGHAVTVRFTFKVLDYRYWPLSFRLPYT